jgi:hypothetical protein
MISLATPEISLDSIFTCTKVSRRFRETKAPCRLGRRELPDLAQYHRVVWPSDPKPPRQKLLKLQLKERERENK